MTRFFKCAFVALILLSAGCFGHDEMQFAGGPVVACQELKYHFKYNQTRFDAWATCFGAHISITGFQNGSNLGGLASIMHASSNEKSLKYRHTYNGISDYEYSRDGRLSHERYFMGWVYRLENKHVDGLELLWGGWFKQSMAIVESGTYNEFCVGVEVGARARVYLSKKKNMTALGYPCGWYAAPEVRVARAVYDDLCSLYLTIFNSDAEIYAVPFNTLVSLGFYYQDESTRFGVGWWNDRQDAHFESHDFFLELAVDY
jgi:hypothetical protein